MLDESTKKPRRLWPVSLAIHLILLGVIFFIPAKEYFEEERGEKRMKPPEIPRRGEELEEIMEQVRDLTAERLAQKVELLDQGEDRMATNFETLNEFHQPFEEQRRKSAMTRMAYFAERALDEMNTMRKLLIDADKAASPEEKLELLENGEQLGSRILVGQEEIRRGLMFLAPDDEKLIPLQTEAENGQIQAVEFNGWALGSLRGYTSMKTRISEDEKELASLRKTLKEEERKVDVLKKKLEPIKDDLKKTKDDIRKNRKDKDLVAKLKDKEKRLDQRLREANGELRSQSGDRNEVSRALTRVERSLQSNRERLAGKDPNWENFINTGKNIQSVAFYKQREVINELFKRAGREPILTDE